MSTSQRHRDPRGVGDRGTDHRGLGETVRYAQLSPRSRPQRVASDAQPAPVDRSPISFDVVPLKNRWACWYTAMLILLRWRDSVLRRNKPRPELERVVFSTEQRPMYFDARDANAFVRKYRLASHTRDFDIDVLRAQMRQDQSPQVYMADAGGGFQHMLVICALEYTPLDAKPQSAKMRNRRGLWTLRYVDSFDGQRKDEEFTAFFRNHPPPGLDRTRGWFVSAPPTYPD